MKSLSVQPVFQPRFEPSTAEYKSIDLHMLGICSDILICVYYNITLLQKTCINNGSFS
jgi:hypothetical protein